MLKLIALLGLSLMLYGCSFGRPLSKEAKLPKSDETYFIIGVKPSNYKVQIFQGSINNVERFTQNPLKNATFSEVPDKGYAVGRTDADTIQAITSVYHEGTGSFISPFFTPCKDGLTPVFSTPGGKVIYLLDVYYENHGGKLKAIYSQNFGRAKKYLEKNYPDLAPALEQGDYSLLKTTLSCDYNVYIPAIQVE